ncbi:FecCD family ABC transporter permease [Penaeicola halotolerans]|uniref:FecCD family ABC transporter permease n=1 Tax=Penaeicola halotolerans TaxID=2793196 RepID=UPI001CF8A9A3|nr:iron ABC transporter permease [Penaeicola halotolerans]
MLIRSSHRMSLIGAMLLILIAAMMLSAVVGAYQLSLNDIFHVISYQLGFTKDQPKPELLAVFWNIRLPRILLGAMVGAALAIAGAALQGLFRNPLVESGLIGVSSGGALMVVILIVFSNIISLEIAPIFIQLLQPLVAFIGGLLLTIAAYKLSKVGSKADISLLILSGVAINALAGALIGLTLYFADDAAIRNFTFWSLGDLGGANWLKIGISAPLILGSIGYLLNTAKPLNLLSLGESEAFHMGLSVEKVKTGIILAVAMAVGVSVAFTGIIGFVGLVIPHIIRLLIGADHKLVLPLSVLLGASFLVLADLASRVVVSPSELPIGIITSLAGAPFFIWLLINFKKKSRV